MNSKRRVFLKGTLAAGTVGVAVGAGLLTPSTVLASAREGFEAGSISDALQSVMGSDSHDSGDITISAPELAENGAVVPITVESSLTGVTDIAILAAANNTPLTSSYKLGEGTKAYVATRIKMGESSDIVAVLKSNGQLYSSSREVKVTIGGCGG
ncbi:MULTISPECIES: thiosulfate oxidation carrier protein SoxY [Ectothiorhodospira]|uniref:Sulfur oxidation protein SoxY n=1 Tax=Ectothiorhodospira haloalkaliphila TaxID=421628 RepID=W8KKJ7_9GAMM|nr:MULTISPECIES: thiosulfate oxidation carrier protein SoxY [Ectothiorhodospira]TVQ72580.1 MAG: thiosulfate oxidation carrier protein SoxY [Chromatiaceae bacterium]AHK79643.1 sulfur oxidation protein SoxY [Ectothiorhodospira haloalkaliphila]ANB01227.1 sulfur oxidation protein SoxY [Ectothiorhodospira sp. BSL-9]MCG5493274.1 thiosulfate oxidation carrier protein SoxY [Ectothiorhodospira variabilis]MCG5496616.1 thiosulfate oxidation carrier protein SoxY [Ectothiorhodospira variabilis]